MKAVLISIQPKWCELIASRRKTIEVRKTRPKMETPFKCYIYCTKQKTIADEYCGNRNGHIYIDNGKVIGEFVCDCINNFTGHWLDGEDNLKENTCLNDAEIMDYIEYIDKTFYLWHISKLKIYYKPKDLGEFKQTKIVRGYHKKDEIKQDGINIERLMHGTRIISKTLTRPPQSWCYVEELL